MYIVYTLYMHGSICIHVHGILYSVVSYSKFEWSDTFGVSVPEILYQFSIPFGHDPAHSQGVVPAINTNHSAPSGISVWTDLLISRR